MINDKSGYRATAFGKAGNYVSVNYLDECGAKSFVYDYLGNKVGVGVMEGENYYVVPYVIDAAHQEQYHDLRTTLLKGFLRKTQAELVLTNHCGVYAYLYAQRNRKVLIVVNSTEEDFDQTSLEFRGVEFSKIYKLSRSSGRKVSVKYKKSGDKVDISTKNEHLTTQTFVIE